MNQLFNEELQGAGARLGNSKARSIDIKTNTDLFDWFESKIVTWVTIGLILYLCFGKDVGNLMKLTGVWR